MWSSPAARSLTLTYLALPQLVTPEFYNGWRCQISYSICKLLFALSAFPFLPLMIGTVNTLFTHAVRTAYTPDGVLTAIDQGGLSYICIYTYIYMHIYICIYI